MVVRAALDAARSALAAGDTATAEAQCRRALAAGDDGALAWTLLGQCLRRSEPGLLLLLPDSAAAQPWLLDMLALLGIGASLIIGRIRRR